MTNRLKSGASQPKELHFHGLAQPPKFFQPIHAVLPIAFLAPDGNVIEGLVINALFYSLLAISVMYFGRKADIDPSAHACLSGS